MSQFILTPALSFNHFAFIHQLRDSYFTCCPNLICSSRFYSLILYAIYLVSCWKYLFLTAPTLSWSLALIPWLIWISNQLDCYTHRSHMVITLCICRHTLPVKKLSIFLDTVTVTCLLGFQNVQDVSSHTRFLIAIEPQTLLPHTLKFCTNLTVRR